MYHSLSYIIIKKVYGKRSNVDGRVYGSFLVGIAVGSILEAFAAEIASDDCDDKCK